MKRKCRNWIYIEHFLLFNSGVAGCVSISAFASLVGILIGIASSASWIKNMYINCKKHKKKYDKIVLLGKAKLDTIEVLMSKDLIALYISHGKLVSVNDVKREYKRIQEMK